MRSKIVGLLLTVVFLLSISAGARAQWELDSARSTVNFVSIKNGSVGETHSFTSIVGFIGEAGNVQLAIDLDSVETLIEVRNERMREVLFETAKFPAAKIEANVDQGILQAAAEGGVITIDVPVSLSLHGEKKTQTISLVIVGEGENRLRVFSAKPILVNAVDYGLVDGINALREIAGLKSISSAVPVTLQLLFTPAQ